VVLILHEWFALLRSNLNAGQYTMLTCKQVILARINFEKTFSRKYMDGIFGWLGDYAAHQNLITQMGHAAKLDSSGLLQHNSSGFTLVN